MKTDYQFIRFEKIADKPKTSVWACLNIRSGTQLGTVMWYGRWRQYCYFQVPGIEAVYSAGCLGDINAFIAALKAVGCEVSP